MLLFKKNYFYHLYIFFLVLVLFFSEFSTNIVSSKNYNILDIKVEEKYDINFDKSKVINKAFDEAFDVLIFKLIESKDRSKISNISLKDKKNLIENFSISNEQFINNNYIASFNVQFSKRKILSYLNNKYIIPSSLKEIETLLIPVLIDADLNELYYLNQNDFYNNWNLNKKNYYLINYILPNEDIEDYAIIKKNINNIENYNFKEIINKYNLESYIILIILKDNDVLRIFSKVKFDKKKIFINNFFNRIDINNEDSINGLITNIKENYEDRWKSLNKFNTSIALPLRLSLDSNNVMLSKKLEKVLIEYDLVSDYKIEKFNSKTIVYKIIFNSSPDKFFDKMLAFGFSIDTTSDIWKLK